MARQAIWLPGNTILSPGVDFDGKRRLVKAAISTGDFSSTGKLNPIQAKKFIDEMQDVSKLKPMVSFRAFDSQDMYIERSDFSGRASFPQSEGADHGVYRQLDHDRLTLTPERFTAVVKISDEALDVNVEGKNYANLVLKTIVKAIANDMDELILDGDESGKLGYDEDESGYDDGEYKTDLFLNKVDGVITQLLNGNNTLDVSGFTTKSMNPAICAAMRNQLPINSC